jgi:hypothetical protein
MDEMEKAVAVAAAHALVAIPVAAAPRLLLQEVVFRRLDTS